jgi:hypothetical protein
MTRRRRVAERPGWLSHFIPVLAAALTIAVPGGGLFRAKSGRHQQRLLDHDASLNDIKSKLHEIKKTTTRAAPEPADEFLKKSEETAKGIAELNTHPSRAHNRRSSAINWRWHCIPAGGQGR